MARPDSQRLEILLRTRDCIDDALLNSAHSADVVSYTLPDGRSVNRSRTAAQAELDALEKRIQKLQLRINGPAVNYAVRSRGN